MAGKVNIWAEAQPPTALERKKQEKLATEHLRSFRAWLVDQQGPVDALDLVNQKGGTAHHVWETLTHSNRAGAELWLGSSEYEDLHEEVENGNGSEVFAEIRSALSSLVTWLYQNKQLTKAQTKDLTELTHWLTVNVTRKNHPTVVRETLRGFDRLYRVWERLPSRQLQSQVPLSGHSLVIPIPDAYAEKFTGPISIHDHSGMPEELWASLGASLVKAARVVYEMYANSGMFHLFPCDVYVFSKSAKFRSRGAGGTFYSHTPVFTQQVTLYLTHNPDFMILAFVHELAHRFDYLSWRARNYSGQWESFAWARRYHDKLQDDLNRLARETYSQASYDFPATVKVGKHRYPAKVCRSPQIPRAHWELRGRPPGMSEADFQELSDFVQKAPVDFAVFMRMAEHALAPQVFPSWYARVNPKELYAEMMCAYMLGILQPQHAQVLQEHQPWLPPMPKVSKDDREGWLRAAERFDRELQEDEDGDGADGTGGADGGDGGDSDASSVDDAAALEGQQALRMGAHRAGQVRLPNPRAHQPWDTAARYLTPAEISPAVPYMEQLGVSEVARSERGFLHRFNEVHGRWDRMGEDPWSSQHWLDRQANFVARHETQRLAMDEPLWMDWHGERVPTRRHLGLIAWAWTPDPKGYRAWLKEIS